MMPHQYSIPAKAWLFSLRSASPLHLLAAAGSSGALQEEEEEEGAPRRPMPQN